MNKIVQVVTFSDKNFKSYSSFTKNINKFLLEFADDDIVTVTFSNETSDAHGICMIAYKVTKEDILRIEKLWSKITDEDEDEDEDDEEDDETEEESTEESTDDSLVKIK